MSHKVKIGCLAEGMEHYEFKRNSGLRREDFEDPPWWRKSPDWWVVAFICICGVLGIWFSRGGV